MIILFSATVRAEMYHLRSLHLDTVECGRIYGRFAPLSQWNGWLGGTTAWYW